VTRLLDVTLLVVLLGARRRVTSLGGVCCRGVAGPGTTGSTCCFDVRHRVITTQGSIDQCEDRSMQAFLRGPQNSSFPTISRHLRASIR
jgi:hypothetical protein